MMNINLIKLTQSFTNFSETSVEEIINEYNTKQTLNNLFNSIMPQDNKEYSISFRENYFKQILTKINPNFLQEEERLLSLFCLIRSYGNFMEDFIYELLEKYNKIEDLTFSSKYFNFIKYRIEFSLFCFMVLDSTQQFSREILSYFKKKVDKGNIDFKNYCT